MSVPLKYQQPDAWPHAFTPKGKEYDGPNGRKVKDMICTYCYKEYTYGVQPRPTEPCKKRTDRAERSRLFR